MTARRIGLVGLGVISRFYLAALDHCPDLRLAAVCDTDASVLAAAPAGPARFRDHRELLGSADVDAVVVNVPNDRHAEVCRDALTAGLAVCVEKPLTTRLAEAGELVRLAERTGAPLFTAFHRRHNDQVVALHQRLHGAAPVTSMSVRYEEMIEEHAGPDRWYLDPARCGGGCVADNGPNAFDLVRLFLGDVQVTDTTLSRDARGVDRQASIQLRAASGGLARVALDWSYPGERKTVEVRLADGTVDRADLLAGHRGFKGSLWHEYVGVLQEFGEVLRGVRPAAPDGLAAVELVAASYARERPRRPLRPLKAR